MKTVRITALSLVVLALTAGPAGASTGAPIVADARYKWFFWIGWLLVVGTVAFIVMFAVGYALKVLRPKYRGRPSDK